MAIHARIFLYGDCLISFSSLVTPLFTLLPGWRGGRISGTGP
jgi:hypothetical protein